MYKIAQILILIFLLNGCGFHLAGKGTFTAELSNTHILSVSSSKEMLRALERSLNANQINVVAEDNATALLNILNEETEKVVITVDNDGKAREFELLLQVSFEVKKPDNSVLLDRQNINISRDFVFDKDDLLSANEEEQELYNEMRKDVARLIVYRLQTI